MALPEEGTPFIPAHGMRRILFTPRPAGFRFYHTHNRAGADLHAGQYSGQVGPVYIEPKHEPGSYDREVFLVLKEFEPSFSQGGDMAQDFLAPSTRVKELESSGESAMKASLAKGMPHGYEVGYRYFTINGRMLGHGEPVRVKPWGERVLFHILNAQRNRDSQLGVARAFFQGCRFRWKSGSPTPAGGSVLWLGTAEAHFCHRRDDSSWRVDHGVILRMTIAVTAWVLSWNMRDTKQSRRGHRRNCFIGIICVSQKPVKSHFRRMKRSR